MKKENNKKILGLLILLITIIVLIACIFIVSCAGKKLKKPVNEVTTELIKLGEISSDENGSEEKMSEEKVPEEDKSEGKGSKEDKSEEKIPEKEPSKENVPVVKVTGEKASEAKPPVTGTSEESKPEESKSENKSEEKSEEKSEDKSEDKTEEKSEDKSEDKTEEKSEEKSEDTSEDTSEDATTERTVLLYICGSDLERKGGMASFNIKQILSANFSSSEEVKFLIMTGGTKQWTLGKEYLAAKDGEDLSGGISNDYNQIWEAKGADARENPGKLVLLDGDGITGAEGTAVPSSQELMSDPETLRAFINYGVANYPAERYDLILWDHGGGPGSGFAWDEHDAIESHSMSFPEIVDAVSNNDVTKEGGEFDIVDFDACIMGGLEYTLALSDSVYCYVASPELEPGYGQDYTGWLNKLGEDSDYDAYDLGKIIVDDFYNFYESGPGQSQDGTLAVINTDKMTDPETGFLQTMSELNIILQSQAENVDEGYGDYGFYDEMFAFRSSLKYGSRPLYDLGNAVSLLGLNNYEYEGRASEDTIPSLDNSYTNVSVRLLGMLENKEMIYGVGTSDVKQTAQAVRESSGEVTAKELRTSGIYLAFPDPLDATGAVRYLQKMKEVTDSMEDGDAKNLLSSYMRTYADYAIIQQSGRAVQELLNPSETSKRYIENPLSREEINFEEVDSYWKNAGPMPDYVPWATSVGELYKYAYKEHSSLEEKNGWLDEIICQQATEGVLAVDVSAKKITTGKGTASQITIENTNKRVIATVVQDAVADLPVLKEYIENETDPTRLMVLNNVTLSIGSVDANLDSSDFQTAVTDPSYYSEWIKWQNEKVSTWNINPPEEKWYAMKDENGAYHVASIKDIAYDCWLVPAIDSEGKEIILVFSQDDLSLVEIGIKNPGDENFRDLDPEALIEGVTVTPCIYLDLFGLISVSAPISTPFTVSGENFSKIRFDYVNVSDIPDIQDTDGDGDVFHRVTVIKDIYGNRTDVSEIANRADTFIGIELAEVSETVQNQETGEYLPVFTYDGKILEEGTDYTLTKYGDLKTPGPHEVMARGIGKFAGEHFFEFEAPE